MKSLQDRVTFVCSYILQGRKTTRAFDGCFEDGDGDEVAARVYKRALKNQKIMDRLPRYVDVDSVRAAYERLQP